MLNAPVEIKKEKEQLQIKIKEWEARPGGPLLAYSSCAWVVHSD
jgi:hypothetical protein